MVVIPKQGEFSQAVEDYLKQIGATQSPPTSSGTTVVIILPYETARLDLSAWQLHSTEFRATQPDLKEAGVSTEPMVVPNRLRQLR
jgi:hypothetical protein